MSANLQLAVWQRFPGRSSALLALMAIAEAANEQGNCGLAISELGRAARVSRETVFRALRALRENRWILTHSKYGGQRSKLVIQINIPKLMRTTRRGVTSPIIHAVHTPDSAASGGAGYRADMVRLTIRGV